MRIKLILNPLAGFVDPTRHLEKIRELLGPGNELDIQLTKRRYDSFYISQAAARDGYDLHQNNGVTGADFSKCILWSGASAM